MGQVDLAMPLSRILLMQRLASGVGKSEALPTRCLTIASTRTANYGQC